jgi:hypothetical protein
MAFRVLAASHGRFGAVMPGRRGRRRRSRQIAAREAANQAHRNFELGRDQHGRVKTLSLPDPKEFVMPTPNAGEGEAISSPAAWQRHDGQLNIPTPNNAAAVCYAQLKTK